LSDPFAKLITEASLAKLAGERSFARGAAYFENGAVTDFVQTSDAIKARVLGSDEYRVVLRPEGRSLEWSCTCPLGEEGEFCKHAVAAGLAWLERREAGDAPSATGGDELDRTRSYLESQSKETLVDLLLEQAGEDPELRARLQAEALRRDPPSDPKALKEIVRRALAVPGGFADYRGMRAFIARADSAADLLRNLLRTGRPAEAATLADYAVRRGISAYARTDDSGGAFGETLGQIAKLHLEACRAARPEGEALAAALFELQLLDDWGFFDFEDYAPLLGEKGVARYRALAEKAWSEIPVLEPGARREPDSTRSIVTRIMETLARRDGDPDALVAVKSRDLSHSHAFLEIAQILANAGRHDEALAWAERGRKSFPTEVHAPLVEFLVAANRRQRRHTDAANAAWDHFSRHPGLSSYKLLKKAASGNGAWNAWREKALAHVRAGLKDPGRSRGQWHSASGGHSLLVEIFLDEGDSGAALAEAKAGGCTADLWMKLANARAKDHPHDAIEIYQARLDPLVNLKHNQAYDDAAELVGTIKKLMERVGKAKEFGEWLAGVKVRHKAKRNFMKRLEDLAPI
jgi:uncharacterized Zn finger protein